MTFTLKSKGNCHFLSSSIMTWVSTQNAEYLLSSFTLGFVFLLLAAKVSEQGVWRGRANVRGAAFRVWLASSSRNVSVLLSIPVHVLLRVRIVVVLQKGRAQKTRPKRRGGGHAQKATSNGVLAEHLERCTFTTRYLGVGVIVETGERVVIEAGAFVILVRGHVWHS